MNGIQRDDGFQPGDVLQTHSNGHQYQIQTKLSDKAGRQTYLAHDQQQDQPVILKLLNFDATLTWDHFKLFEREAKTLQTLSHPAIPKYIDYLDVDAYGCQGFALVQTYISGQSLESYLQAGRTFSEAELKQLAQSLLGILSYLHNHHPPVIHRDIKPSNILLDDLSGNHLSQIYLVDFGSVQTVASKESGTITIVGSYGYIPYEQFCGQAAPASDLYSLGMTLLYLATGVHPADQPQKQGEIQIKNTGLSSPFEQWLEKMTCPRLDRRFSDPQASLDALINGNTEHLNRWKPPSTNVDLKHTSRIFDLTIPKPHYGIQVQFWPIVFYCFLFAVFWMFLLPICFILLISALFSIGRGIKSQRIRHIQIDDDTITLASTSDEWRYVRTHIRRLCYARSYEFNHFWDSDGRKISRGKVKISPRLMIVIGGSEFTLEGLSDAEYWWIGQELSDFLGLELQLIYPTPKVPPEPSCGGGC